MLLRREPLKSGLRSSWVSKPTERASELARRATKAPESPSKPAGGFPGRRKDEDKNDGATILRQRWKMASYPPGNSPEQTNRWTNQ